MPAPSPQRWAELAPQLDALLTLPPRQRREQLAALAANDPATADELRALLDAHESAERSDFLAGATRPPGPAAGSPGTVLGAWTLVEPLGEGGMGSVWRARRSDGRFEGEAAIKLLKTGLADAATQARFRREGALLARMQHPGIAPLLDAGIATSGQPYLVLQLVQGQPIDVWCRQRALGVRERLQLFVQVLDAVAGAHAQLVLHRDLKPSNILVDDNGRVQLLDFGIARLLDVDDPVGEPTALTQAGALALTARYAAPEQFEGGTLSTATDVWQLGVVLYELLTQQHPGGPAIASLSEHLQFALQGTVRPASQAAAAAPKPLPPAWVRALRGDVDTLLAKALKRAPAERYAGAVDFADDLRRHLALLPIRARPDSLAYRSTRWLQRNRGLAAAGVLAVLSVTGGVFGVWNQSQRAQQAAARAEAARTQAQVQQSRAERERDAAEAADELMRFLLATRGETPISATELLQRAEQAVSAQFAAAPALRARLLLRVAQMHDDRDEVQQVQALLQRVQQASAEAGPEAAALTASADCLRAGNRSLVPEAEAAEATFAAALAVLRDPAQAGPEPLAQCLRHRGYRFMVTGEVAAASRDLSESLALLGTPPRPGLQAQALSTRLTLSFNNSRLPGQLAPSVKALRDGLDELTRMGRGQTEDAVIWMGNLAVLEFQAGQWEAAVRRVEASPSPAAGRTFGCGHGFAGQLPATHRPRGRGHAAVRAGAPARQALGDTSGLVSLDAMYVRCPVERGAAACGARAESRRAALMASRPHRSQLAQYEAAIGQHALARDDLAAARAAFARALEHERSRPSRRGAYARALVLAARTEVALGEPAQALALADEAVAHAATVAPGFEHTAWQGQALLAQALAREASGQPGLAREAAEAAMRHLAATVGAQSPAMHEAQQLLTRLRPA